MRERLRITAACLLVLASIIAFAFVTRRVPATPEEMIRFAPVFADEVARPEHAAAIAEGIRTHASAQRYPIIPSEAERYLFYLPEGEGEARLLIAPADGRIYETVRIVAQGQVYFYLPELGMLGMRA